MTAPRRLAGIPDGLPPDEFERWSNDLVEFLTSDRIPAGFRAWAREQAGLIDAHLASAEELEADIDADDEDDEGAVQRPPVRPAARGASRRRQSQRQAPPAPARTLVLQIPEQFSKLLIGAVIGALVLAAIFGVRALTTGGEGDGALPQTEATDFDQTRANELQALLAQDPANLDALFELGEMNFEAGRNEDAITWFSKLVELDPQNKHALTDLGTANFNLNRPDQAKMFWQKVIAIDPNDVQAHYNMGFVLANAEPRDLAAAIVEWETVMRLDPESQLAQTARVHIDGLRAELGTQAQPTAAGTQP